MRSPAYRLIVTCVISCTLHISTSAADTARELRVLTYNIHHGEGIDGKLDLERIAKVITAEKPDLVALQEVDQKTTRTGSVDQPAQLAELTGMHASFGKAMDYRDGAYGVAVLSKWPVVESKTDPLPAGARTEPRAVLSTVVAIGDPAQKIRFMVTHVDHRSDPKARTEQVKRIMELFPPADDTLPAILAGDLNASPESEVIKMLLGEWTDSAAGKNYFTIPAEAPKRKIDFILYRPAARWRVKETRAIEEPVASDHRPVLSVLELVAGTE